MMAALNSLFKPAKDVPHGERWYKIILTVLALLIAAGAVWQMMNGG